MSIFNRDHYPTPTAVIDMMVVGLDLAGKHVLEPSAGAGNIIDHVTAMGAIVTSCEKVEDLARICATKSKFLKHDFLEVTRQEASHIDYIIMNPPFSADARHILHAWEVAPDGCEVIALCNWETINNKFTASRSQLGRLVNSYGHATNLGDVFKSAERTTLAEIGLVHLYKPASESSFEGFFDEQEDEQEQQYNGIMPYNAVREAVQRYVEACRLFDQVAENAVTMHTLVGVFGVDGLTFALKQDDKEQSVANFKVELQKRAWQWVFSKMNMQKFMTSKLKEELNAFVEKQKNVPFTMRNIYRMFEMVVGTHQERMNRVMVEVFDRLTERYHENRYHIEGWKTNSHYMVNKKFIIEGIGEIDSWNGDRAKVRYGGRHTELLDDMTKALCYITGQQYNQRETLYTQFVGTPVTVEGKTQYEYKHWGTWYDWGFFKVKLFKKGTLHAQFLDPKVWEQFNRAVAKAKGYTLPEKI
jgi:predicted RNA methylase